MEVGDALTKLLGGLLLAAGILIALSCGLCTGYFGIVAVGMLFDEKTRGGSLVVWPFLFAGLIATVVGFGLAWGGLALLRRPLARGGTGPADREG